MQSKRGVTVKLSGRQLAVMRVLWQQREATVAEVQQALETDPPLAYSTVATVLSRMERKGLITHRVEDRQYYYRAVVSEVGANQSVVGDLVDRVFGGSPAELVNQLLASDQVDADELERIKQLVNEHAKRTKRKS
ncbi:BlaI/MecI/CopY family transcriptional regulator [Neorhodopirellula pilleata]|uniref:Penicillinase repressor n=1 Tax=Neorhodopirellula pilleata TaxID=2714738 RepID=A0A5C5ZX52_9BACT|nr:BlaI/MecI/CopY family transcriptional regulator [Neorhodopirellula pilleata]TWT91715.1 Penicillinase repressor [Neorhodopirellula pilleata]